MIRLRVLRAGAPVALVLVLAAFLAGCGAAAGTPVPIPSGALVITTKNTAFVPADSTAPATASTSGFQLYFDNADTTPHNMVFVAADGTRAFQSDTFTGSQQRIYNVPALAAGTYKVACDIHPEMKGTLTVP